MELDLICMWKPKRVEFMELERTIITRDCCKGRVREWRVTDQRYKVLAGVKD
jgi:hypothetical protein